MVDASETILIEVISGGNVNRDRTTRLLFEQLNTNSDQGVDIIYFLFLGQLNLKYCPFEWLSIVFRPKSFMNCSISLKVLPIRLKAYVLNENTC